MIYVIGILSVFIFTGVNLYIGITVFETFKYFVTFINSYVYWIVFLLLVLSFFIGKFFKKILPEFISKMFYLIGCYWLAVIFYFIIAVIIFQIIKLTCYLLPFAYISDGIKWRAVFYAVSMMIICVILIIGTYNANSIRLSKYNLQVEKNINGIEKLNIVMISDIHAGRIVGKSRVKNLVKNVNSLKPDLVILAGDIIDDDVDLKEMKDILTPLKDIDSAYGVYAVFGNHEYIGRNTGYMTEEYKRLNIKLLVDEFEGIDNRFYIIGRNDIAYKNFTGKERKNIFQLTDRCDKTKLLIAVDHRPVDLENCKNAGIDVQFSGHTHRGQLHPLNLITKKIFRIDWGYLKDGKFNIIVSSGFGTWGPPIRIHSRSEIVEVILKGAVN
ncbi:metallophosphoesterase [Clostridium sp. HV4-5-A1G]|uniref:metallophosphoesterase n=1 Tax=Clostridium sp. HV4-5-A1G TaxID=2004595 RepID=UPI00123BD87E|nr:metallophosphoesterase [Clostridium sp. HV4-5-A1G]KAA8663800.1 metallophosphoesterase [Clostridium sp. HV4-5-A1G]